MLVWRALEIAGLALSIHVDRKRHVLHTRKYWALAACFDLSFLVIVVIGEFFGPSRCHASATPYGGGTVKATLAT